MDLKMLRSFISVANHQNFSAAARELHTVQPAISRHIAQLESSLGVSLFVRNSREVMITPAGEQLLQDAQHILKLIEMASSNVKRAHHGEIGTLKIAHMPSACLPFMATLVSTYRKVFPDVHVSLFEMTVSEQLSAFEQDSIDIGFSRPMPSSLVDSFVSHDIYIDQLVVVVNENHPLAAYKMVRLEQLQKEPFILFNRDEAVGLFDDIILLCRESGFSPNIISQPRHMQTLLTEVAAGLGVAIGPQCITKQHTQGCHFLTISEVDKAIPLQLHYKRSNHSAIVKPFIDNTLKLKPDIETSMNR
ncbi:Transcriptional Regulator, LysR family protein [Methylophaga frappieri]|uniref:Transcriptional Regulator, LysR family protein n=1 Tax=Methylophaga frappieri (strain ATCC BAA-2434 / DSM 25690 / JAM7) TaxID=754477 RepID=I1YG80_METFJ|nr:LysR family transcriptional regulator [Methylophaga frappieri]AFJ01923.1 Transcriptional Regulator, LysR family protein [Methylophaga frappieri]